MQSYQTLIESHFAFSWPSLLFLEESAVYVIVRSSLSDVTSHSSDILAHTRSLSHRATG